MATVDAYDDPNAGEARSTIVMAMIRTFGPCGGAKRPCRVATTVGYHHPVGARVGFPPTHAGDLPAKDEVTMDPYRQPIALLDHDAEHDALEPAWSKAQHEVLKSQRPDDRLPLPIATDRSRGVLQPWHAPSMQPCGEDD
jgi:hypothetical protein